MATQLFLLQSPPDVHLGTDNSNLDAVAVGWLPKALSTSRGSGVVNSAAMPTEDGPTPGIEIIPDGGGSTLGEWISPPVSADVTISGTITANIWAQESSMNANVAINVVIEIIRASDLSGVDSSNKLVEIVRSTNTTELASAGVNAVNNFTTGMTSGGYTSQTLNRGDRLRIRVFGDDAGVMGAGFTFTVGYNGTTAAVDGDSYITFSEDFSFESAPSGSQLFLTNTQSGLSYGTPVAPALISSFTGSNEDPLSESGNWAIANSSGLPMRRISNTVSGNTGGSTNASYWTPANFGPDIEAYITITTIGSARCGICARIQGEGGAATWDGYVVAQSTGTQAIIYRVDNNVFTTLATLTKTWANGDKLGVRINGSLIQCWRLPSGGSTWQLVGTATDTTYPNAGKIGLFAFDTDSFMDDFYAATDSNLFTTDAPELISDFTGADENPLSEGGNWANLNTSSNALRRISNAVSATVDATTNMSYWTPGNFGADLEAYVTISTIAGTAQGIAARIQGEGGAATWDGYRIACTTGVSRIEIVTNGSATTLLQESLTWASGDKIGVRCVGSTIQLWRQASGSSDWTLRLTVVDATYASAGKVALYAFSTTTRLDDFYAATGSNLFTQQAWTSRGSGVVSYLADTDTGWTAPLLTHEWYTRPLTAFTLTGMAQANIRALESSASANASLRCEIARVDNDGSNATVWSSWCMSPTALNAFAELGTSEEAWTVNLSGDALDVSDGQRLRLRLYIDDQAAAAMGNAFNAQPFFNGTSAAASGDSYVRLAQTVTEFVDSEPALVSWFTSL